MYSRICFVINEWSYIFICYTYHTFFVLIELSNSLFLFSPTVPYASKYEKKMVKKKFVLENSIIWCSKEKLLSCFCKGYLYVTPIDNYQKLIYINIFSVTILTPLLISRSGHALTWDTDDRDNPPDRSSLAPHRHTKHALTTGHIKPLPLPERTA